MVVQQERQHSLPPVAEESNIFVNSGSTSSGKGRSGGSGGPLSVSSSAHMRNTSNKKCAYCHRTGHTVETCYAKHDYPPGHPRYPGRPRFNPRDGTVSMNNAAQEVSNHGSNTFAGSSSDSGFHMTQAQYQTLINLLQSQPLDTDGTSSAQPSRANLTQVTQQSPQ